VEYHFDAGNLDDLVKGVGLGNVRHNDYAEFIRGLVWVGGTDRRGLLLGPDRGDNAVALGEELFEDVGFSCQRVSAHGSTNQPLKYCSRGTL